VRSIFIAVFALVALVSSAQAKDLFYECDIPQSRSGGNYISTKMAIIQRANGAVQVIDAVLMYHDLSPLTVRVQRNTERVMSLIWAVDLRSGTNQKTDMRYNVRFNKETGRIQVTAVPQGYSNQWTSRGTCKLRKS